MKWFNWVVATLFMVSSFEVKGFDSLKVAFLADVHLQNIYGEFEDTTYKGVLNPTTGKYVTIRTMQSQLNSTRIFNENYFAFLAALEDIVRRGIKFVVLPGDFSDDGQPMNISALKEILEQYSAEYGIVFLLSTGNHDPVRPYTMEAGKKDFLGAGGKKQAIMSHESLYSPQKGELPLIVTKEIKKLGYQEIVDSLANFGFYPKKEDLYWSTPFSQNSYDDYDYQLALKESKLEKRNYKIGSQKFTIPDVSYVVEPIDGIWFLSIDANVYVPKPSSLNDSNDPESYHGASIGYNQVLSHKKHIIPWIEKVVKDAKRLNKTLVPFSHFPMIDFNDDATSSIKRLMGHDKMQLARVPSEQVARAFAEVGLKVHFGGHMHINDTGERDLELTGDYLVNVQIPSLAAYIPAYKVLTIHENSLKFEVETTVLDSVPRFNELFALYEMELDFLKKQKGKVWNQKILSSKNYHEYTEWHLKELIRFRFLKDWPEDLKSYIIGMTGKEVLYLSQANKYPQGDSVSASAVFSKQLEDNCLQIVHNYDIDMDDLDQWTGGDLILDLYRLRSADELAFDDVGVDRLQQYEMLYQSMKGSKRYSEPLLEKLFWVLEIVHSFAHGKPSNHFIIDMENHTILRLEDQ